MPPYGHPLSAAQVVGLSILTSGGEGGGEGGGGEGEGGGGDGDGGGGDGGGGLGGVDGGAEGGVEGGIHPMYSRKACCSWSDACCFAITASKRDFTSAISGEQPHVVDVGGHGGQGGYGTDAAPMPSSRQEARRHLSSTVPWNLRGATFLERLPAWDMRGESRSCAEHERRVAASSIGPEGVASGGGPATRGRVSPRR